jgi:hypothetical protein
MKCIQAGKQSESSIPIWENNAENIGSFSTGREAGVFFTDSSTPDRLKTKPPLWCNVNVEEVCLLSAIN